MKKIYAFSKYIFYAVGGAEKSTFEILKRKQAEGYEIHVYGCEHLKNFVDESYRLKMPEEWQQSTVKMPFSFKRFLYVEYFLNRKFVRRYFADLTADGDFITYGFYGAAAGLGYQGKTIIYLRSESDLGYNDNYYTGVKKWVKRLMTLLEYPFYKIYVNDLRRAYQKAELVCNSRWMQQECLRRFSVQGSVDIPFINAEDLKKRYMSHPLEIHKGIVFIGDSEVKGISLVEKIAALIPEEIFFIFKRNFKEKVEKGNICYMPWVSDNSVPYSYAKLVIVPSIGREAYGRVSAEAVSLKIPVLVSARGGLPETVDFHEESIVQDYRNPTVWVQKIRNLI